MLGLPAAVRGCLFDLDGVIVLRRIAEDGLATYEGSVRYVRAARDAGLRRVVVSASVNLVVDDLASLLEAP